MGFHIFGTPAGPHADPENWSNVLARQILTDEIVRNSKPGSGRIEIVDAHRNACGLALRIAPSGTKSWTCRFESPETGERRRATLGTYPALSLADAREASRKLQNAKFEGIDQTEETRRKLESVRKERAETLTHLIDLYLAACERGRHRKGGRPKRESVIQQDRYYWQKHIQPVLGGKAFRQVDRADIEAIVDRSPPSTGRRVRALLHAAYEFADFRDLFDKNPARKVQATPWGSRDRVMTDDELKALWQVLTNPEELEQGKIGATAAKAVQLCALTLQRRAEVAGLALSELDIAARLWSIPAARMKSGRPHVVPLSQPAIDLIEAIRNTLPKGATHLFPASRGTAAHIQPATVTGAFIGAAKRAGIHGTTLHDLRRTGSTRLTGERLNVRRFDVSLVLGHSDGDGGARVTATYDRNAYLPQRRAALDIWGAELTRIVEGRPIEAGNVLPITGRRA